MCQSAWQAQAAPASCPSAGLLKLHGQQSVWASWDGRPALCHPCRSQAGDTFSSRPRTQGGLGWQETSGSHVPEDPSRNGQCGPKSWEQVTTPHHDGVSSGCCPGKGLLTLSRSCTFPTVVLVCIHGPLQPWLGLCPQCGLEERVGLSGIHSINE